MGSYIILASVIAIFASPFVVKREYSGVSFASACIIFAVAFLAYGVYARTGHFIPMVHIIIE